MHFYFVLNAILYILMQCKKITLQWDIFNNLLLKIILTTILLYGIES